MKKSQINRNTQSTCGSPNLSPTATSPRHNLQSATNFLVLSGVNEIEIETQERELVETFERALAINDEDLS